MPTGPIIPDEAIRYILFQRTGYLRFPVTTLYRHLLRRLPFHLPVYNLVVGAESRIARSRVRDLYIADMQAEFDSIRDYLPDVCTTVLDIGCGVAGIDVFLDQHYGEQAPDFYLLDRSQIDRSVYYMFNEQASFYNSLDVARKMLIGNDIPADRIHLREVDAGPDIHVPGGVGLAISLLAWGFHFPVDTYAQQVRDLLSDDGVVILDVRSNTDGMETLRRTFGQITVVLETEKYTRVAARP